MNAIATTIVSILSQFAEQKAQAIELAAERRHQVERERASFVRLAPMFFSTIFHVTSAHVTSAHVTSAPAAVSEARRPFVWDSESVVARWKHLAAKIVVAMDDEHAALLCRAIAPAVLSDDPKSPWEMKLIDDAGELWDNFFALTRQIVGTP